MNSVPTLSRAYVVKPLVSNTVKISAFKCILITSVAISLLYNVTFWSNLFHRFQGLSLNNILFSFTILLLMVAFLSIFLSVLVLPKIGKPVLSALFILCSLIAYFNSLGIVIDEQMLYNIAQTDRHEALELLSGKLLLYVVCLGLAPSYFLLGLTLEFSTTAKELASRLLLVLVLLTAAFGSFYANFRYATYFGRENRDLRLYLNPAFPILSVKKVYAEQVAETPQFQKIGQDAVVVNSRNTRTVGIIVVGETARADHFSINGYRKLTNPRLTQRSLLNFSLATSCGTSTAYSVPCMFSFLNADNYSTEYAQHESNLLDVLQVAGVQTLWRDNNSTCKGVCVRTPSENFRDNVDSASIYFNDGEYFDEVLLSDLDKIIDQNHGNLFIVLHQLGSHGPAYYKRYPSEFEKFTPACKEQSPHSCTSEEVNNSYDNTILYTDFIIDKAIRILQNRGSDINSFVLYASDHGESLGENGVYLHGLPLAIAPQEQTHIPFLLWLSPQLKQRYRISEKAQSRCKLEPVSHDNIVHTVLALFEVKSKVLDENLNLLNSACL